MARRVGSDATAVDLAVIQSSLAGFAGAVRGGADGVSKPLKDPDNWYFLPACPTDVWCDLTGFASGSRVEGYLDAPTQTIHALNVTRNHDRATKKKRKVITQRKKESNTAKTAVDSTGPPRNPPLQTQLEIPLKDRSIAELRRLCEDNGPPLPTKGKSKTQLIKLLQQNK